MASGEIDPLRRGPHECSEVLAGGVPQESHDIGGFPAEPPSVTVCLGAEREGLPPEVEGVRARIPVDGAESLNVAAAAAIALYELRHRMARHA